MVQEPYQDLASELIRRARGLTEMAAYGKALDVAHQAIRLDPTSAEAHRICAWALENLGPDRQDDARTAYERAVTLDPGAFRARTALADLLRRSGRVEEAERLYRAVADDAGNASQAGADTCRLEMGGWSQYRLGRLDDAIALFNAAVEQDEELFSAWFDLALALLAAGQGGGARQTYESAIARLRTRDPAYRIAPLTIASEDVDEAIATHPSIVDLAEAATIRTLLRTELQQVVAGEGTATD